MELKLEFQSSSSRDYRSRWVQPLGEENGRCGRKELAGETAERMADGGGLPRTPN